MVCLVVMQTHLHKTIVQQHIGALLGAGTGLYLDNKEKKLRQQMQGTGVEVNRNPDGSVALVMPGSITFDTNKSSIKPNFYGTLNKVAQTLMEDKQECNSCDWLYG